MEAPSLLLLDDLAHRVHCLADAAADMALSLLGLALSQIPGGDFLSLDPLFP
jgi:hypothetical protein